MADVEWIAYCSECKEVYNAANGGFTEAAAKKHKRENPDHTVILGTYVDISNTGSLKT